MKLGLVNTRMKDFFDIWILSQQLTFIGESLQNAIKMTFNKRQTAAKRTRLIHLVNRFTPIQYINCAGSNF